MLSMSVEFYCTLYLDKASSAVRSVREALKFKNYRTNSYGFALITGGWEDCYAEFVENGRTLQGNIPRLKPEI